MALAGVCVLGCFGAIAQDIVVGQIGPFTVLPAPDALHINQGAQAYFDMVNAGGGVRGRKISFFKLDDKFNGDEFARQLEEASTRKPVALISPIGSAAMGKLLKEDLLDKYNFVIVNAIPGADVFRKPGHKHLFHIRASDGQQIDRILRHASTVGIRKMHVFHQDLAVGTSALAVAKELGVKYNVTVTGVQSKHEEATLQVGAKQVFSAIPDGVLVIGSPKFAADAIAQLRKAGMAGSIFTTGYMPASLLAKIAGDAEARGVGISQTYPNPNIRSQPLQRDFQEVMKQYAPDVKMYSSVHLEGYLSARVLVEGLKQAGSNAGADRLAAALKNMGRQDFGGFIVDFSKGNSGSNFVDIGVVAAGGRLIY